MAQLQSFSWFRRATVVAALSLALPLPVMSQAIWKVGDRVSLPPLELLDGQSVDWAKLSGKVIVLEFWGTWCPFCARQNPVLDQFYRDYQTKGLEVITISLDKTKDAASAYMKKGGYAFTAGMATPAWQAIYKQRRGLPQLMVIDRSGKLVMIEVREMLEDDIRDIAKFL